MSEPLSTLRADLFLLHAPSVYDFRERDDVLFAYLSDSDSVNVTSIYEMYPIGFLALKEHLRAHGLAVDIVNVAALMLQHPALDVDRLLERLEAPVFGVDLHWLAHCHGAIELAGRIKRAHPEAVILCGGISATYYAEQLIQYPAIDVVVQGYDTLEPTRQLVERLQRGERNLEGIPNLLFKRQGRVERTGFAHKPARDSNDATVDWGFYRDAPGDVAATRLIMTLPNTGCAYDCGWCGGSRSAFQQVMGVKKTLIPKSHPRVVDELRTLGPAAARTGIYALQCYSETRPRFHAYLEAVREAGYRQLFVEQFHLTPEDTLRRMGQASQTYILLSPESHDPVISKLSGRGTYTMEQMEAWIPRALDAGIAGVLVWFFIGMPQQTPQSISDTVDYCIGLLERFPGRRVLPLLCPMVPFLDPGSRFFEDPEPHGYRLFHRTLEEHRRAMVEPLWHRRLNYETRWLSRRQLQDATYGAVARLVDAKGQAGVLPRGVCQGILSAISETETLLGEMERALTQDGALPAPLRDDIRAYNRRVLSHSSDQIVPLPRPFGGRWFDDFTVPASMLAELQGNASHAVLAQGGG
ncbi:cobalamin-dependent protein [Myxococcaceae bacterium JPH2]|nr:cobalamin-dependent protein [Myxococcaceae bacterium JPH2]